MIIFVLLFCITTVLSHGNMVMPTVWWDKEQIGMLPGAQCSSGYSIDDLPAGGGAGTSCFWFTNDTFIPHSPTLDDSLRTYRNIFVPGFGVDTLLKIYLLDFLLDQVVIGLLMTHLYPTLQR